MPTPAALPSINTLLKLGNLGSPETFTTIANVGSINGLSMSANVVDVTSHSTDVPWRQKITTLLDAGELTFDLYFIPSDTGHQALLAIFVEKDGTNNGRRNYQIWFPDAAPTKWAFSGYISQFSMGATVDGVATASITIVATGEPDFTV